MANEPLSPMTILELTQLVSAQDDRWLQILTHAQSTHHPLAQQGIAFFKNTWRRAMGDYYQNIVNRFDAAAKAPMHVLKDVLDKMADVIYPAARAAGLSDDSFVFPDIMIERRQMPSVSGQSWMYW
jgi:hypothetical protein